MTTTVHRYRCDICRRVYETQSDATRCEASGKPQEIPVGALLGDPWDESSHHSHNLAFAVAGALKGNPHDCRQILWACRDNGSGDSLGKETCGGETIRLENLPHLSEHDLEHPTFVRLIAWLRARKIYPLVNTSRGLRRLPREASTTRRGARARG